MSRPSPLPHDLTAEEGLLAPVCNAWRRELIRYCARPRQQREVFREFIFAGKKQRYAALNDLCTSGWLRAQEDTYSLNVAAMSALQRLSESVAGLEAHPFDDVAACDASVAALRRQSCRAILDLTRSLSRPVLWRELRDTLNLTSLDTKVACTILTEAHTLTETARGVFVRTGHGFPAVYAYLDTLKGEANELPGK